MAFQRTRSKTAGTTCPFCSAKDDFFALDEEHRVLEDFLHANGCEFTKTRWLRDLMNAHQHDVQKAEKLQAEATTSQEREVANAAAARARHIHAWSMAAQNVAYLIGQDAVGRARRLTRAYMRYCKSNNGDEEAKSRFEDAERREIGINYDGPRN